MEKKSCSKCNKIKNLSEYFVKDRKSGRLHAQCKECYKVHRKSYYQEHYSKYRDQYRERARTRRHQKREEYRQNMSKYLSDKCCVVCGEEDISVLEFDHIDSSNKQFSISQAIRLGYSWKDVELEIKKCQILCANCHKRKTASEFNWYKNNGGAYG